MNKLNRELSDLGENLVSKGLQYGADEIEIAISDGVEFTVTVLNGKIEKLIESGFRTLSAKVILDQKTAVASSSDFKMDTLNRLLKNAIARADISSSDPCSGLPDNTAAPVNPDLLQIYDPEIARLSPEDKIERARKTESLCLNDNRIKKTFGASFDTTVVTRYMINSKGFNQAYTRTQCGCGVYLQSGDGDNLIDEGWYDRAVSIGRLWSPEAIAEKAVHRVTRLIGARKIPTQNVPVIYEPGMTEELLRFLGRCISGDSVYKKQSFLAESLGKSIASNDITLIDDGLMPGGIGSRPFDSEGVAQKETVLIDQGILQAFMLDTYSAKKLKSVSNGHASGIGNLYLKPGPHSPESIIKSVNKGLLLTGSIGFGEVTATGDISKGAFGLWIENGEIVYPVAEITISGNLGNLLNQIEMIGNDLEIRDTASGPTLKIAEMTIGGTSL